MKVTLCACDKYDQQDYGSKYYTFIDKRRPIEYTDNPFPLIHKADKVEIDTLYFKANELACIVNSLISEGYEIYYKPYKEDGEQWVFGNSLFFKISKENKAKLQNRLNKNDH